MAKPEKRGAHAADNQTEPTSARQTDNLQPLPANAFSATPSEHVIKVKKKKKMKTWKKVLLVVLVVLVLGVGSAFAAGMMYANSINSSMSYSGDQEQLDKVLTKANATEPFYVLVIGSDDWEGHGARSDAMVLCRVDLNTPQVTMVSIPRDTPYVINGVTTKLNEVYSQQGEIACVEAVSQLTGVPIAHYVEVKFDQLEKVVDTMGGLTVDVPYAIDYTVYTNDRATVHIDKGVQTLNGEQAVALARMRTAYGAETIAEDAIRQANIRAMMTAMMKQVLKAPVAEIPGQISMIAGMVETDIPLSDLVSWAGDMSSAGSVKLYSCTGPFQGGIYEETGEWLTYDAPEQWKKLMEVVDAGGDPTAVTGIDSTSDGSLSLESTEEIKTDQAA